LLAAEPAAHRLALWIKVDTGMNRLGFRPEAFRAAYDQLCALRPAPRRVMPRDQAPVAGGGGCGVRSPGG
jgi:alanine racemase